LGLLKSFVSLGLLGPAGTRPRAVVTFVLLMEGCMPPAQNSVIMLQLEGLKERASTMAKLLTLMYSLAVIPVTILLSACLATSGIMAFK
jgi:predicted permease